MNLSFPKEVYNALPQLKEYIKTLEINPGFIKNKDMKKLMLSLALSGLMLAGFAQEKKDVKPEMK